MTSLDLFFPSPKRVGKEKLFFQRALPPYPPRLRFYFRPQDQSSFQPLSPLPLRVFCSFVSLEFICSFFGLFFPFCYGFSAPLPPPSLPGDEDESHDPPSSFGHLSAISQTVFEGVPVTCFFCFFFLSFNGSPPPPSPCREVRWNPRPGPFRWASSCLAALYTRDCLLSATPTSKDSPPFLPPPPPSPKALPCFPFLFRKPLKEKMA